ncbi:MAG: hypothetical protein KKI20_01055 [Gammaproteobacteria bacterium]|nr:hypothetical protein [Gammaproteobacteria bacterium]
MKEGLKENWCNFASIVFRPYVVLLIICTIILGIFTIIDGNLFVTSIFTAIIAVLGGLCGAAIENKWHELIGETLLIAQGKNAVRNLKLLLSDLLGMQISLTNYQNQSSEKQIAPEVLKSWLKETTEKITMVQKQGINAIEAWSSWIPETDISTQIETRDNLQEKILELEKEKKELQNNNNDSSEKNVRLERELDETKEELRRSRLNLDKNLFGPSLTYLSEIPGFLGNTPGVPLVGNTGSNSLNDILTNALGFPPSSRRVFDTTVSPVITTRP